MKDEIEFQFSLSGWQSVIALGIVVAFASILVLHGSCGTTFAQKVNLTNEATRDLRATVGPQINAKCKAAAVKCKTNNIEKKDCRPLTACRKVRDAFYEAVEGVHVVIALYKVKKAVGKPVRDLAGILAAAQKALDAAMDMATKAGYITLPQPTGAGHWGGPNS